jgi:3',5'-cyclic-AMP phosphodiesterase
VGMPLTRRQALSYAALVGATIAVPTRAWGATPSRRGVLTGEGLAGWSLTGNAVPMHLELVTVTDTTATLTWYTGDPTQLDEFGRPAPVAAPGRVLIGTTPVPLLMEEVQAHGATPYHHVEITGLTPGTRYFFVAESNGVPALATTFDPVSLHPVYGLGSADPLSGLDASNLGTFTTMTPPPGREIMRVAWMNDMHFGEDIAGIITRDVPGFPTGFPPGLPVDPENPYWRVTGNAALAEARQRGAQVLMVNGDLTAEARPDELDEIKGSLDAAFGTLGGCRRNAAGDFLVRPGDEPAYWVTRGNHDRAHRGELYAGGSPVADHDGFRDTFLDAFRPSWAPGATSSNFTVIAEGEGARWRFVGLDSSTDPTSTGTIPTQQLDYLAASLEAADEPTFVLIHHPAGEENALFGLPPAIAGVNDMAGAAAFRAILADHGDVVTAVHHGHTHRNNHTRSPATTGPLPFLEGAATKEYPAGYCILRLFEGGYMVNFHKCADPEARAWSQQSRAEFFGAYPYFSLGSLQDRNLAFDVDARRTTSPQGGVVQCSPPRPGINRRPAGGGQRP